MDQHDHRKIPFTQQRRDTSVAGSAPPEGQASIPTNRLESTNWRPSRNAATSQASEAGSSKENPQTPDQGILLQVPDRQTAGRIRERSASIASVSSYDSATSGKSAFSGESLFEINALESDRSVLLAALGEEEKLFPEMEQLVKNMLNASIVQKNMSIVVKEGLKETQKLLQKLKDLREVTRSKEEDLYRGALQINQQHDLRKKQRRSFFAQTLRDVAMAETRANRPRCPRSSPPAQASKKKKKKEGKKREEPVAKRADRGKEGPKPKSATKKTLTGLEQAPLDRRKGKKAPVPTLLVDVAKGRTYADVLGRLRKEIKPDEGSARVLCARPTRQGGVLLQLNREAKQEEFAAIVRCAVQDVGTVRVPDRRVTLEIMDLDSLTSKEEVVTALNEALSSTAASQDVVLLGPNRSSLMTAIVKLGHEDADKLKSMRHLRIGFVSCRVRDRVMVVRCHRCLDFGHIKKDCKGVDRSSSCFKCGEPGHKLSACVKVPQCFLCQPAEGNGATHVAGSGACAVFRRALEAAKKAASR